jgi:hypothetical protein
MAVWLLHFRVEELGPFLLGEVTENYLGAVWVLDLGRLGGHATQVTPGPDAGRSYAGPPGVAHAGQARERAPGPDGVPSPDLSRGLMAAAGVRAGRFLDLDFRVWV